MKSPSIPLRTFLVAGALLPGALMAARAPAAPRAPSRPPAPLAYDPSAYELAPHFPVDPPPWNESALRQEILARAARERQRRELTVNYYRIGHTLAFPLPVSSRPTAKDFPPGISTITYPWVIWLSWALEERWRIAHAAWRRFDDRESGQLLQRELAALTGWERFHETRNEPGLATGHIAGCLAQALASPAGWDPQLLKEARAAAEALIERDVWPWFGKVWDNDTPYTARRLANIPVITLARAAQLARVTGSPRTDALERKTVEVLQAWTRFRTGREHHTEGTAYDGYLMDTLTDWLAALPQRAELLRGTRDAFRGLTDQWIDLTLPGRFDLHAPIGDVEPEMMYWAPPLMRFATWYQWRDAAWLLSRVPLNRLPAAALVDALGQGSLFAQAKAAPPIAPREHPHAIALRTGWTRRDLAAVVSVPRNAMGHLHADTGHVVLGWEGRHWITDPGYQQYRPGEERTYTLGLEAHNYPVINGTGQKPRAGTIQKVNTDAPGGQHAALDLGKCYEKLPAAARVQRDVWLAGGENAGLVVRDTFHSLGRDAEIATHWLGGTHFAWTFVDGWARLSNGEQALWIGTPGERIAPAALTRHAGSRGPLTLGHRATLPEGAGVRWWVFWCDAGGGWTPPSLTVEGGTLRVTPAASRGPVRTFGG